MDRGVSRTVQCARRMDHGSWFRDRARQRDSEEDTDSTASEWFGQKGEVPHHHFAAPHVPDMSSQQAPQTTHCSQKRTCQLGRTVRNSAVL